MSSGLSRSGGKRKGTTLRRKNRSSRNCPCWINTRRSRCVAATMRTFVRIGVASPYRNIFALLQNAQQPGLRIHRHVADLVEKQRSALRLLEATGVTVDGAREGSFLMAEQLGLDQLARDGRHVHRHERSLAAPAEIVKHAGHEFLAASRLHRR